MKTATAIAGALLLAAGLPAVAALDLSRPGALDRLRAQQPAHYDAVLEVARLGERLNCDPQDIEALKARFPVDRLDCGFVSTNGGVAQRRMKFELGGTAYSLTVRLQDTAPKLIGR